MRIAVVGAGAVGCYYGALLAQAGHQVVLIGRAVHVEAICSNGLIVERSSGSEVVALEASVEPKAVEGADLILVCVKSADTKAAAEQIAPYLAPEVQILSLQNGVGNAEVLAGIVKRPVIGAAVYVGTQMAGAGHVRHHGLGSLMIGSSDASEALAAMLVKAAIPTTITDDIDAVLWAKLTVNCAYNALSAIADQPYGRIVAIAEARQLIEQVVAECGSVARACGVRVFPKQLDKVMAVAETMAGQYSSTAQDLRKGRSTEIDYLNGYIVRLGGEHGIPVPANQALLAIVKIMESTNALRS